LSEPGNKESTGNLTVYWERLPQQCILLSYALRNAYPVPDRKDCVSLIYLEGGLRERSSAIPDTVMLGTDISLEMTI
jgi:hypothetical protein